jgi:Tol biopolymer transport system component
MGTDGTEKQVTTTAGEHDYLGSFSPDGKTIVYVSEPSASNDKIVTINIDGTNQKTIYMSPGTSIYLGMPVFSPDGKSLVFYIDVASTASVTQMHRHNAQAPPWLQAGNHYASSAVRGSAQPQVAALTQSGWYTMALTDTAPTLVYSPTDWWGPAVFSADGTMLLLTMRNGGSRENIYSVNLDGSGLTPLTTSSDEDDFSPVPYGNAILFNRENNANSSIDIYVMDETGANQALVLSTASTWDGLIDTYWEND